MDLLFILSGYLTGAIPFGLLFGRYAGIDIRKDGSGNIGATNVNRLLGRKLGILTLLCDVAKGYLPMLLAARLLSGHSNVQLITTLTGAAAFAGHCFPVYLRFKGGKGVATALGIYLFLAPAAAGASALIFALTVGLSGFVSLGSLAAAAAMPLILWLSAADPEVIGLAGFVGLIIWLKHSANINRLIRGEEKKPSAGHAE